MSDRLDRIEEMLAVVVSHAEATDSRINRLSDNQLLIQQDLQLLTHRVDRLTERMEQFAERMEQFADRMDQFNDRMEQFAERMEQFAERAEQDRNQAAIDRAEFRSTVQQLLQVLIQQHNGNGRGEG